MTELAYMIRSDWAQRGTAMAEQSAVIRAWLDDAPYAFTVADAKKLASDRPADLECINYIEPDVSKRRVFSFSALQEFTQAGEPIEHTITLVHPYKETDCEVLREVIQAGRIARLFVIIWSRSESVRVMLDGLGGVPRAFSEPRRTLRERLRRRTTTPADGLLLEARRLHHRRRHPNQVRAAQREPHPA